MREIIEFWRAVEMFSPPAIPRARPAQRVFDVAPGEPLPWNPGHPVQATRLTKDQAWRHTVYVGLYPRERVFAALRTSFRPRPTATRSVPRARAPCWVSRSRRRAPCSRAPRCSRPVPGRRREPSIRDRRPPPGSTASPTSKRLCPGPRGNASRQDRGGTQAGGPRLGHPHRMPGGRDRRSWAWRTCCPSPGSGSAAKSSRGGAPTRSSTTSSTASSPTTWPASPPLRARVRWGRTARVPAAQRRARPRRSRRCRGPPRRGPPRHRTRSGASRSLAGGPGAAVGAGPAVRRRRGHRDAPHRRQPVRRQRAARHRQDDDAARPGRGAWSPNGPSGWRR